MAWIITGKSCLPAGIIINAISVTTAKCNRILTQTVDLKARNPNPNPARLCALPGGVFKYPGKYSNEE